MKNRSSRTEEIGMPGRASAAESAASVQAQEVPMESSCTRPARRVSSLRLIVVVALLGSIAVLFGCANGEIRLGDPFDRKYAL